MEWFLKLYSVEPTCRGIRLTRHYNEERPIHDNRLWGRLLLESSLLSGALDSGDFPKAVERLSFPLRLYRSDRMFYKVAMNSWREEATGLAQEKGNLMRTVRALLENNTDLNKYAVVYNDIGDDIDRTVFQKKLSVREAVLEQMDRAAKYGPGYKSDGHALVAFLIEEGGWLEKA